MKTKLFTTMMIAGFTAFAGLPEKITSTFHTGYIPDGFDTNDQTQIVGEGLFPNSCYRPAGVQVNVDHEKKLIDVKAAAYVYDGFCLQMVLPYNQVLDLGILKAGTYAVKQREGIENLGLLKVRLATNSGPDDFLYAPVSQAYFSQNDNTNKLVVSGEFTNSCMKLVDVMVTPQPQVIVVQPVAEMEERTDCVDGSFPYEKSVDVNGVNKGRYLLHIRSINGKAINNLIDVR